MLEKKRTQEHPRRPPFAREDSQNRTCRAEGEEETSIEDCQRGSEEATQGTSSAPPKTDQQAQHRRGQERLSGCRSKLRELVDRSGTSGAAGIGTRKNLKSVGGPLGVRDANSWSAIGSASGACTGSAGTGTTDTLIRDPFSPDERRRLTTNTTSYKHWVSSSSIVHDIRQDDLNTTCCHSLMYHLVCHSIVCEVVACISCLPRRCVARNGTTK